MTETEGVPNSQPKPEVEVETDPTVVYVPIGDRADRPLTPEEAANVEGLSGYAIVVEKGPRKGMSFLLKEGNTTVGRHPESDIFLNDVTVSRHHCRFVTSGEVLTVEDSGSTNGTYVNDERVDSAELSAGDEVLIGRFHFVVARGMPEVGDLSIGEVINLLRDDFPDVSVSKIRFLESQGLIDPDRSGSGYRRFDSNDIARLRFILQQQRDHFLPLKVIKSKLTLWERGEDLSRDDGAAPPSLDQSGEPLDRSELLKRSKLDESQLEELIDIGLIRPIPDSVVFPPETGIVAMEAKRLMDHGLEARHLRTIRLSTERESDLLKQLVAPLLKASNPEAKARARDVLESVADSVQAMHRALLTSELRQHLKS